MGEHYFQALWFNTGEKGDVDAQQGQHHPWRPYRATYRIVEHFCEFGQSYEGFLSGIIGGVAHTEGGVARNTR